RAARARLVGTGEDAATPARAARGHRPRAVGEGRRRAVSRRVRRAIPAREGTPAHATRRPHARPGSERTPPAATPEPAPPLWRDRVRRGLVPDALRVDPHARELAEPVRGRRLVFLQCRRVARDGTETIAVRARGDAARAVLQGAGRDPGAAAAVVPGRTASG